MRPRRRAERDAHRHLLLARRGARHQQARDVRRRDQQQQADGGEQQQHRLPHVATTRSSRSGVSATPTFWLAFGKVALERRGDGVHVGLRAVDASCPACSRADHRESSRGCAAATGSVAGGERIVGHAPVRRDPGLRDRPG